ncbi:MAG: cytochrome c [Deltaproteobacteria bacterium]|nr:cytochrome c [Deltaproteobacteria bacterium]
MKTKYLHNKKFAVVSILSVLSVIVVIAGIYLFSGNSYSQGMNMMKGAGAGGGSKNGMMSMMTTGKIVNNMGHRMFPKYKGIKTGPALFHYEGCIICHTISGLGGGMKDIPNLSHIGSIRSFSWIATQIADPSAHFKRNSIVTLNGVKYKAIMPSFKNMSSKNIGILAKYLESLK